MTRKANQDDDVTTKQKKTAKKAAKKTQKQEKSGIAEKGASDSSLTLNLSRSLIEKIKRQAEEEGISIEEYVTELLSESVVLRAWEIVERKSHLSSVSGNTGGYNNHNNSSRNNNRNNRRNDRFGNNRRMSQSRYNNLMEDKASFLEYVRNQERQGR